jgi:hypothetical protein
VIPNDEINKSLRCLQYLHTLVLWYTPTMTVNRLNENTTASIFGLGVCLNSKLDGMSVDNSDHQNKVNQHDGTTANHTSESDLPISEEIKLGLPEPKRFEANVGVLGSVINLGVGNRGCKHQPPHKCKQQYAGHRVYRREFLESRRTSRFLVAHCTLPRIKGQCMLRTDSWLSLAKRLVTWRYMSSVTIAWVLSFSSTKLTTLRVGCFTWSHSQPNSSGPSPN